MESLPIRDICKKYSQPEAICYISKIFELLEENRQSKCYESIQKLILRIAQSYIDYYHKFIDSICEECLKKDILGLFTHFFKHYFVLKDNVNKTLILMHTVLINFSDHSENFSYSLSLSKIMMLLIDNLLYTDSSDTLPLDGKVQILRKSLKILNNVYRNPQNVLNYRTTGIKNVLIKFIKNNDSDELGILSILLLSYLVEESEIGQLDDGLSIINKLIMYIEEINAKVKRLDGFTLKELLHGLRCLSCNDNMKVRIDEEGGIPLLLDILQSDNEEIIELILGTIENLCFDNDIKQKLKVTYHIEDRIKSFENSDNVKIKRIYEGILWRVQNRDTSFHCGNFTKKSNSEKYFDVFLSYSWTNKEKVIEICSKLKSYKIQVWIDEERMEGSSVEAMANGIENSKIFIMAISSSYKNSGNCRHEAEYAFKIRKPIIPVILECKYKPSSWLGFIMGNRMYFEFSERRNADEEIVKLRTLILSNLETSMIEKNVDIDEVHYEININKSRKEKNINVLKYWSNKDVSKWLEDHQLGYLKKYFSSIDGNLLQTMLNVRSCSAEYVNNSLKNDFGMTFLDVIKFHNALDCLNLPL